MTGADREFAAAMRAERPARDMYAEQRTKMREGLPTNDAGDRVCPKCGTVVPEETWFCDPCEKAKELAAQCRRFVNEVDNDWLEASGWGKRHGSLLDVPGPWRLPRWDWARLDNEAFRKAVAPKLLKAMERWNPSLGNLVLAAPTGSGKSSLAVAKLVALYRANRAKAEQGEQPEPLRFRFMTALELVSARRTHKLGTSEPALINEAMNGAALLILDEVGFEDRKLCDSLLLDVADARYRNGARTLVTTGRRPSEFAELYGAATWRRLTEGGHVIDAHPPTEAPERGGQ